MNLLIVESKPKARTIQKYLGSDFLVRACRGHVQDLPTEGKQGRKAMWASRQGGLPEPPWEWTEGSREVVESLVEEAREKGVERVFIATDPDREGEFIAWRLSEILEEEDVPEVRRITFQEITEDAVQEALERPRPVDPALVDSARVRRFMDRLVGFRASKFARSWFRSTTSMGRVQTPTLGFVVERELEREAFVPVPYFTVVATAEGIEYRVQFHDPDDPDAWRTDDGKFHADRTHDDDLAEEALEALQESGEVEVTDAEHGTYARKPRAPFTTDALLRAAGSELGWSPRRTMSVANQLYSNGHITYIRTDSTRTGSEARQRARRLVAERWGDDHLGPGAVEDPSSGPVQDAHEAIRPTRPESRSPTGLDKGQQRLYLLIWARFTASQMSPSKYRRARLEAGVEGFDRPLKGTVRWRVHPGWEAAYEGLRQPPPEAPPSAELEAGAVHALDAPTDEEDNPGLIEDETRPPARYRQHTLISRMKEEGIGRPSTYAPTVEKLLDREYCVQEGKELVPTEKGRTLWLKIVPFYSPRDGQGDGGPPEESAGEGDEAPDDAGSATDGAGADDQTDVFSTDFTARMEETLDEIEAGERPAPAAWMSFRERFRAMHNVALERRRARPTRRQIDLAERLLDTLDDGEAAGLVGDRELEELTGEEISELLDRLQELTDDRLPPSKNQLAYIRRMAEELELSESEAAGLVGAEDLESLSGGRDGTASELIEELKDRRARREKPASDRQLRFIEKLVERAGMDEAAACQLVDADSYGELTGGREGTASELIDRLQQRVGSGEATTSGS